MTNNIDVSPGEKPGKQAVATIQIDGVHYPVYMNADSTGALIDADNPLPVALNTDLTDNQLISNYEIRNELVDIGVQLKILNKYLSKWHGEEINHEDIDDDHH